MHYAFLYGYHALLDAGKKARNRADLRMGALQHSLPVDTCSYPKLLCHCANSDSLLGVLAIQHPAPVPAVTSLVRCVLNNHSPAASQTSFALNFSQPHPWRCCYRRCCCRCRWLLPPQFEVLRVSSCMIALCSW